MVSLLALGCSVEQVESKLGFFSTENLSDSRLIVVIALSVGGLRCYWPSHNAAPPRWVGIAIVLRLRTYCHLLKLVQGDRIRYVNARKRRAPFLEHSSTRPIDALPGM